MLNWFVLNSQKGKVGHFPAPLLPRVFRKPTKKESPLKNKMLKYQLPVQNKSFTDKYRKVQRGIVHYF